MAADAASDLDTGKATADDAADILRAMAGDLYALAYGFAGALDVPPSVTLSDHAAAAIVAASGAALQGVHHAAA